MSAPERTGTFALLRSLDREFSDRLDLWGAYFRILVVVPGLILAILLLPERAWVAWLCASYLCVAISVPVCLRSATIAPRMHLVRPILVLVDVVVVSLLTHGWGTQVAPSSFLYVPIVVGWTLVPQRGIGLFALLMVLSSMLSMLCLEALGAISVAPYALPGTASTSAPGGPVMMFALFSVGLGAVHVLVSFVVQRLAEHASTVSQLRAEKRVREREAAWALEAEERQRLEALGRLAGGVAHDFNNLLTALVGFSDLALRKLHTEPAAAEISLKELGSAAERAANLTQQLLDFASRRSTQPRPVDLRREVTAAAQLLARVLRADITLEVQLCDEPCVCHMDPSGLERVLVNLAVNARDAMPTGGKLAIGLTIDRTHAQASAILTVRDDGRGIDPADLPRIFEPFFTTKARGQGSGLGLASVYGVVKQSGGDIDVSSEPGKGTAFRIRLPLAPSVAVAAPEKPAKSSVARGEGAILLVDDDAAVRAVTRSHLEAGGFRILEAASGSEALSLRGIEQCRLLVSDVAMPGMSGLELSRALRTAHPSMPILLISGYSDADIAAHEQLPEGTLFLSKPFTRERLLSEVSRALSVRE